ncbi:MAG: endolytic transglycosylase MltG, partial [Marinilabiliaceae bacterium]
YFLLTFQQKIFGPNVELENKETASFYIPTGATYQEVTGLLEVSGYIKDMESFKWVAEKKNYPEKIKAGHYVFQDDMNNNELVNMLRGGMQTPVKVTFNNVRTKEEFAGKISNTIEPDSVELLKALNDTTLLEKFDFTPTTVTAMLIPNTYELWWNTNAESFLERMHREYNNFWNEQRLAKADSIGLTPVEVATLASIVEEETIKEDEKKKIAGLYINRLNKGLKLQADPTIRFAMGDFTIKRVLDNDLRIESPYNTYVNKGLPPGPIRIPSVSGIKAVLDYEDHDFLYMCAREDFSGYHHFAKTLRQHNINARKYREALRQRGIYR